MHASKRAIETTILEAPAKFRSQAGCGAPKQQRKDPTNTHVAGAETLRETSRGGGTCHASQAHEEDAKPSPVATGTEFSTHCEDKVMNSIRDDYWGASCPEGLGGPCFGIRRALALDGYMINRNCRHSI